MGEIKLCGFICERCSHKWIPKNLNENQNSITPVVCPKCKSPYWNKKRENGGVRKKGK